MCVCVRVCACECVYIVSSARICMRVSLSVPVCVCVCAFISACKHECQYECVCVCVSDSPRHAVSPSVSPALISSVCDFCSVPPAPAHPKDLEAQLRPKLPFSGHYSRTRGHHRAVWISFFLFWNLLHFILSVLGCKSALRYLSVFSKFSKLLMKDLVPCAYYVRTYSQKYPCSNEG